MNNIQELVNKAKQNDEQAISDLYNLTIRRVTFLARKYLKDEDAVNDVLQESYVKAFQSLDSLQEEEKFEKWLNTIVARKCKDYLRKRKDMTFSDIGDEDYHPEDFVEEERLEFTPEKSTDYSELKNAMANIIDELNAEQKMCVLMYYYQQYNTREIAETLEVKESTIKKRLMTARKKIKEKVEELESKGYKIRGIAPIPFIIWMLMQEEATISLPAIGVGSTGVLSGIGSQVAKGTVQQATKHAIMQSVKAKVIAGTVAASVVAGGAGYYAYDKSRTINLSENIVYEVSGVNHYGSISVKSNNIEHDGAEKLITGYDIEGNGTLSNGDTVKITVNYDENYMNEHSLKVKNTLKSVKIEGLSNRYENAKQIDKEVLQTAYQTILDKCTKEKRYMSGPYVCTATPEEITREDIENETMELITAYFAKSKDLSKNPDKLVVMIRHGYRSEKLDKKVGMPSNRDNSKYFWYYSDFYYLEITDFYSDSNEKDFKKKVSSPSTVLEASLDRIQEGKAAFEPSLDKANYTYQLIEEHTDNLFD